MIRLACTCALLMSFFGMGQAATIVVPDSLASVEGNAGNAFPFSPLSDMRYQQVYASSQFPSQLLLISTIRFRRDFPSGAAGFGATIPNIEIDLSSTSKSVDDLSTSFSENLGSDDTAVFSGSLKVSGPTLPPETIPPFPFDFVIPLSKPFLFNPAGGNLLMDVRNFGATATTFLDAANSEGDPISRVFTFSSGVNSPRADEADTLGLVTEFEFTPVASPPPSAIPEPSTLLLFVSAVIAVVARRLVHRRRSS